MAEAKFNNHFFALWPDQDTRPELVRLQQSVCQQNGQLHHPQDLHMTLVFLGRVTPEQFPCVKQVANTVVAEPFTVELNRSGFWKRPRVLWCGPDASIQQLNQLVHNLEQGLIGCGFQPERRNYTPHVTLARKARSEQPAAVADPVVWRPREFVLAASRSGAELPRYEILDRWRI